MSRSRKNKIMTTWWCSFKLAISRSQGFFYEAYDVVENTREILMKRRRWVVRVLYA